MTCKPDMTYVTTNTLKAQPNQESTAFSRIYNRNAWSILASFPGFIAESLGTG